MHKEILVPIVIVVAVIFGSAFVLSDRYVSEEKNPPYVTSLENEEIEVVSLVTEFGKQMVNVPLSSPKDAAALAIETVYKPYVAANLISEWANDPLKAPGRLTSSPWPDRIEITSTIKNVYGTYTVRGRVVEVTSKEVTRGDAAATYPVELTVAKQNNHFVITSFSKGEYSTRSE